MESGHHGPADDPVPRRGRYPQRLDRHPEPRPDRRQRNRRRTQAPDRWQLLPDDGAEFRDLPRIAAALADFEELEVDTDTSTVSVPAPQGVGTLSEVFRRMDEIGVELLDISLRRPSLDEVFLHLTSPVTTP